METSLCLAHVETKDAGGRRRERDGSLRAPGVCYGTETRGVLPPDRELQGGSRGGQLSARGSQPGLRKVLPVVVTIIIDGAFTAKTRAREPSAGRPRHSVG